MTEQEIDKKLEESMGNMESFRATSFPNNPVVYAKDEKTGRLIIFTKGEYSEELINLIKTFPNFNKTILG